MRGTFRSLAVRDYRVFVTGHTASQMGTWMQRLAVIWAVFEITDSGLYVGAASFCLFGPAIVLSPLAGLMADTHDSRRLLVATKAGMTATAVLLTVVGFSHPTTPMLYLLAAAVFGVVETFDIPVRMTFVAELVDREDLSNAVGLNSAAMNFSRIIGPAVGGALISGAGVEWCFAVNIGLSVAVLASMLSIKARTEPDSAPRLDNGLMSGFGVAWRHDGVRSCLFAYTVVSVFAIVFPVTLPLFAERSLGGGPAAFTVLFSAVSLGSIAGALAVARHPVPDLAFLGQASVATGVSTAALAVAPNLIVAAIVALAVGAATMAFMAAVITIVHLNAPDETRGRVLALVSMIGVGSRAIGGLILGTVVDLFDARAAIGLGAAVSALAGAWTLLWWRRTAASRAAPSPGAG